MILNNSSPNFHQTVVFGGYMAENSPNRHQMGIYKWPHTEIPTVLEVEKSRSIEE
jgi:hypothetical protein